MLEPVSSIREVYRAALLRVRVRTLPDGPCWCLPVGPKFDDDHDHRCRIARNLTE